MENKIILNRIQTPDGTILTSYNVHDFKTHEDKNGKTYGVDGGTQYLRRIGDTNDCIELSLYDNAPFETIRENFSRLNQGIDGRSIPKAVLLKDMDDEWLNAVIVWYEDRGIFEGQNHIIDLYYKEKYFREFGTLKNK